MSSIIIVKAKIGVFGLAFIVFLSVFINNNNILGGEYETKSYFDYMISQGFTPESEALLQNNQAIFKLETLATIYLIPVLILLLLVFVEIITLIIIKREEVRKSLI